MPGKEVTYDTPTLTHLLVAGSFIYILNVVGYIFDRLVNAGLVGWILLGMVYGPPLADIIPETWLEAITALGYLGLVLLVFEGGITTNLSLIRPSLALSLLTASVGVLLPIALSIALFVGLGYSVLQGFAAGASLCSTSLGTTFSILSSLASDPDVQDSPSVNENEDGARQLDGDSSAQTDLRTTRLGTVLLSAAIADDVIGLVMASVISSLTTTTSRSSFTWDQIARPILVAIAFATVTPLINVYIFRPVLSRWVFPIIGTRASTKRQDHLYIFALIAILSGLVVASNVAGTSELLGAYIAGCVLTSLSGVFESESESNTSSGPSFYSIYERYFSPLVTILLSPFFFASIGFAIPFVPLFKPRILWRGIIYSVIMILAKLAAGIPYLFWPSPSSPDTPNHDNDDVSNDTAQSSPPLPQSSELSSSMTPDLVPSGSKPAQSSRNSTTISKDPTPPSSSLTLPKPKSASTPDPPRQRAALFLGLALVARGEVALLVASLARPTLGDEAYLLVMWAILVSTIVGAVSVGGLVKSKWWRGGNDPGREEGGKEKGKELDRLKKEKGKGKEVDGVKDENEMEMERRLDDGGKESGSETNDGDEGNGAEGNRTYPNNVDSNLMVEDTTTSSGSEHKAQPVQSLDK